MAKQLLKERFQQLAGIKPLYENGLNEDILKFKDYIKNLYDSAIAQDPRAYAGGGTQRGIWYKKYDQKNNLRSGQEADKFNELVNYLKTVNGKATLKGNPDIELELSGPKDNIQWSADVKPNSGQDGMSPEDKADWRAAAKGDYSSAFRTSISKPKPGDTRIGPRSF